MVHLEKKYYTTFSFLTLREDHRLRVLPNTVRTFGHMREKVAGDWGNCIIRSFIICTFLLFIYDVLMMMSVTQTV